MAEQTVNFITYALVVVFGTGSWVAINGLWSELYVLVPHTAEGWNLPAYLTVIIQLANIGPLIYSVLKGRAPKRLHLRLQTVGVGTIVFIGTLACLLLSQLWYYCTSIGGNTHSTALLVLTFFLALVDCTSSVIFLPFLAHYPARYLSALYFGEGLSGLLPASLALIQFKNEVTTCKQQSSNGTNSSYAPPQCSHSGHVGGILFPPGHYFGALAAIMLACGLAFALLRYRMPAYKEIKGSDEDDESVGEVINLEKPSGICIYSETDGDLRMRLFPLLLALSWLAALANGALPAVSSYAYMPYGQQAFLLCNVAGIVANPSASLLHHWLPCGARWVINVLVAIATAMAAVVFGLAGSCPRPLGCEDGGVAMVVLLALLFSGMVSYSKVAISTHAHQMAGEQGLLWCGIVTQIGSFIGAIILFSLTQNKVFPNEHCT